MGILKNQEQLTQREKREQLRQKQKRSRSLVTFIFTSISYNSCHRRTVI